MESGVQFLAAAAVFLFSTASSMPPLGSTHPHIWGLKMITHLYVLLRLRLHGAIPSVLPTFYWHSALLSTNRNLPSSLQSVFVCRNCGCEWLFLKVGIIIYSYMNE